MKKKLFAFVITPIMILSTLAGCSSPEKTADTTETTTEVAKEEGTTEEGTTEEGTTEMANSELEPYEFTYYFNYDYWNIRPWGEDAASKFLKEKFNVNVDFQKPDSDPAAKFNIMVSSNTLPDAIMLDRNIDLIKVAREGFLTDLAPFIEKNPTINEVFKPETIEQLKIDNVLYSMPNWGRNGGATGGNDSWMYNKKIYEQAGSPDLSTLNGLHEYALAVKNNVPTNEQGNPVVPFMTKEDVGDGKSFNPFYRAYGGFNLDRVYGAFAAVDGKMQLVLRDPKFRAALEESNKWYQEGLWSDNVFTDTHDQVLEKVTNGQVGLLYYDFSQDDGENFRRTLEQNDPGNTYEIWKDPVFPAAEGVTKTYGDIKGSLGWNVTVISKNAKNPQRIYDLITYMLTKEGSVNMMYGPKGGGLWDEVDADGNPILLKAPSSLTAEESDALGLWFWAIPGHADNVDNTKFAVNAKLPPEEQNWVVSNQANVFTPINIASDEFNGIAEVLDPATDLGINGKAILDYFKEQFPQIMTATSTDDFNKKYDALLKYCEDNGVADVEKVFDDKYQFNIENYGGTKFEK